jgi:hypothetical protein
MNSEHRGEKGMFFLISIMILLRSIMHIKSLCPKELNAFGDRTIMNKADEILNYYLLSNLGCENE